MLAFKKKKNWRKIYYKKKKNLKKTKKKTMYNVPLASAYLFFQR